jgi:hypothetical protein
VKLLSQYILYEPKEAALLLIADLILANKHYPMVDVPEEALSYRHLYNCMLASRGK